MDLVVHAHSQAKLAVVMRDTPGSLLLTGAPGVGLGTIARSIASTSIVAIIEPKDSKGEVQQATGTIDVATMRALYEQTRTKETKQRVIIIDNADRMSLGAQAAFLKLLEEPTPHTHFILTSHYPRRIVATIRSRTQILHIDPITPEQTKKFLDTLGVQDPKIRLQLEFIASGLPAELSRLVQDTEYFAQRAKIMADTRTFLAGSTYEKLLIVHAYQQDKKAALQLADSALAVTRRSLSAKPQANLINQLDRLVSLRENIEANHSVKLQLAAFVVQ